MASYATYFFPKPLPFGKNYYTYKLLKSGKRIPVQIPCEGVYTAFEMSELSDNIPGEWLKVKCSQVGYVFGLRQYFGEGAK